MHDSIHRYVLDQLEATKGSWPTVARESGVSRRTLEKIARQEIADPGVRTVERLANYFHRRKTAA